MNLNQGRKPGFELFAPQSRNFIIKLFVISVLINYVWEMAQMPFYANMPFTELSSWLLCFRASLGDGVIILIIWFIGYLFYRSRSWFHPLRPAKMLILLVSGAAIAIAIELYAMATDRWEYSGFMPVLPLVGIGIVPFVQLLVLPWLSMFLATKKMSG